MAPEQVRGSRELTPAADVFALGATLYELATGTFAFAAEDVTALLAKVLFGDPRPLTTMCPEAPVELARVLDRMLAKEPGLRYPDGAAVVAALDALGEMPEGPRRTPTELIYPPTQKSVDTHCIVLAVWGSPGAVVEPAPEICDELRARAAEQFGRFEVLDHRTVAGHFRGAPAVVRARAQSWLASVRTALPGWTTAISDLHGDVSAAADHGARALLTGTIEHLMGAPKRT